MKNEKKTRDKIYCCTQNDRHKPVGSKIYYAELKNKSKKKSILLSLLCYHCNIQLGDAQVCRSWVQLVQARGGKVRGALQSWQKKSALEMMRHISDQYQWDQAIAERKPASIRSR